VKSVRNATKSLPQLTGSRAGEPSTCPSVCRQSARSRGSAVSANLCSIGGQTVLRSEKLVPARQMPGDERCSGGLTALVAEMSNLKFSSLRRLGSVRLMFVNHVERRAFGWCRTLLARNVLQ
jgi:hypothetical protein